MAKQRIGKPVVLTEPAPVEADEVLPPSDCKLSQDAQIRVQELEEYLQFSDYKLNSKSWGE